MYLNEVEKQWISLGLRYFSILPDANACIVRENCYLPEGEGLGRLGLFLHQQQTIFACVGPNDNADSFHPPSFIHRRTEREREGEESALAITIIIIIHLFALKYYTRGI